MRKFWFKLFGETKIIFLFFYLIIFFYLTSIFLAIWAAIHFITKYW